MEKKTKAKVSLLVSFLNTARILGKVDIGRRSVGGSVWQFGRCSVLAEYTLAKDVLPSSSAFVIE